jgi:hypothetical protein
VWPSGGRGWELFHHLADLATCRGLLGDDVGAEGKKATSRKLTTRPRASMLTLIAVGVSAAVRLRVFHGRNELDVFAVGLLIPASAAAGASHLRRALVETSPRMPAMETN